MADILQGTDSVLYTIQLKDINGASMSISSLNDYNVYIYYTKNGIKTNACTFKKTPVGNDKSIILVNTYTIGFIIPRSVTKILPIVDLYAECVIKVSDSSDYESSLNKKGVDGYLLGSVVMSAGVINGTNIMN